MSRSKLIIIIVVILSIAIGIVSGIYFYTKKTTTSIQPTGSNNSIFGGTGGVRRDLPRDITNNPDNATSSGNERLNSTTSPQTPILRMIAVGPISGFSFVTRDVFATTSTQIVSSSTKKATIKPKPIGQTEKIRYIERGTGKIYETASSTTNTARITNTTYTKLIESFFDKTGDNLLMRGLLDNSDIIQTRLGSVFLSTTTSAEMTLGVKNLPYNLNYIALSPEKDSFVSCTQKQNLGSSIDISRLDGTGTYNIYKSPFREWLLDWPYKDTVILNTKPSAYSVGFAYSINIKSKSFKRITGGQSGLTTLVSPDGLSALVGESTDGSMKLSVLNLKNNSYRDIYIRTLPEKCVWSKLEKNTVFCAASESIVYAPYPDAWYQGLVFFDDNIWKINTETGENHILVNIKDYVKDGIDAINPTLDKNEDYMMFMNKKDLSLWGLEIQKPVVIKTLPALNKNQTQKATSTTIKK